MKQPLKKLTSLVSGLAVGVVLLGSSASSVSAASASASKQDKTPPANAQQVSGPQAQAPFKAGTRDAKVMAPLGSTDIVAVNGEGAPIAPKAGTVANVDFQTFYNYCAKNTAYTTVRNTTATIKYIQVRVYNQGTYHDIYTSVAAGGSYVYPAFVGIDGAYSAYLYVWNGTSYQYDEYKGDTNTCNVSVTRTYNTGGWVQLKIQNLGTAYATQVSSELAPYPGSGTYTGTHYDYPAAGGAAIYRWFQVGSLPYGIVSSTYGSFNTPYLFTGDH